MVEENIEGLKDKIAELEKKLEDGKNKWGVYSAIITGILGLSGVLCTSIIGFWQHKSTNSIEQAKVDLQKVIEQGKLDIEMAKLSHDTKFGRGNFIFSKIELLSDPKKEKMATAMLRFTLEEGEFRDLMTYLSQYGDSDTSNAALGILEETENQSLETSRWQGRWAHTFSGSSGQSFEGFMTVNTSLEGVVSATFTIDSLDVQGQINGRLSDRGNILDGTWKNTKGQNGRVRLTLNKEEEKLSFSGFYSMFDYAIDESSSQEWSGTKLGSL